MEKAGPEVKVAGFLLFLFTIYCLQAGEAADFTGAAPTFLKTKKSRRWTPVHLTADPRPDWLCCMASCSRQNIHR
jgi:hypothetical protein